MRAESIAFNWVPLWLPHLQTIPRPPVSMKSGEKDDKDADGSVVRIQL